MAGAGAVEKTQEVTVVMEVQVPSGTRLMGLEAVVAAVLMPLLGIMGELVAFMVAGVGAMELVRTKVPLALEFKASSLSPILAAQQRQLRHALVER